MSAGASAAGHEGSGQGRPEGGADLNGIDAAAEPAPSQPEQQAGLRRDRVLVVDDEPAVRNMLSLVLERERFDVVVCGRAEEAMAQIEAGGIDLVLTDVRMPGMGGLAMVDLLRERLPELTVVVMSAFGTNELALEAVARGAYDFIGKPFKNDELVLVLRKAQERERLRKENSRLRARLADLVQVDEAFGELLIKSEGMRQVARTARKVAAYRTTVLVLGESGVGKELVSKAIHRLSPRAEGPFVAVNCAAIPEALLESELFGHVKGAFTDAVADKRGLFEEANGGTLLLDEIGELPVPLQVKLLRVLQEEELRRVGDTRSRAVDVRVIAATSRALDQMVADGSFRQDLFYRINVMPIEVPPLRERREDVVPLCAHVLTAVNERLGTEVHSIEPEAIRLLVAYDWPGNVRELENTIEHAAVLCEGDELRVSDLPERVRNGKRGSADVEDPNADLSLKRATRELERDYILRALARTEGNRTHAARLLQLSHRGLLYKLKALGIE